MATRSIDENLIPLPSVSLISSWYVPLPVHTKPKAVKPSRPLLSPARLPALEIALTNRVALHDLYFLGQSDLKWYAAACGFTLLPKTTALDFASALTREQLDQIAAKLNGLLSGPDYRGTLVGYRPRFTALATYWPFISLPESEDKDDKGRAAKLRENSVKAIRN